MDLQYILFITGFFILGLAVGDKLVNYFPEKIKKNKLATIVILFLIGIVLFIIPIKDVYDNYNKMKIDQTLSYLNDYLVKIQISNESEFMKKQLTHQINQQIEEVKKLKEKYFDIPLRMYLTSAIVLGIGMVASYILSGYKRE